jgi:EmrB/QacA subfamily drug resistance transporter
MVEQDVLPGDKATGPRFGVIFAVVAAGVAMANLDLFVVNVALPDMSSSLGKASLSSLSWVLNGYAVIFAALLVPAGSFADRTSPRSAYLLGLSVFTVASALCAVAPSVWFLVAARLVQAAGAAILIPASLGILLTTAPPDKRGAAVRNWAAISGLAAAVGPVIGGALTQLDWRWVFLINLPVGVATVVVGRGALAKTPRPADAGGTDLLGATLLTVGIGGIALGLVKAQDWGWASPQVVGAFVVSVALLVLFVRRSARHPAPVLPLDLLKLPAMRPVMLANLLFAVAFGAMLLSLALWCEQVWDWAALRTGLAIAPGPLMVPLLTKYAGVLVQRFGAGVVSIIGCVLFGVGLVWWIAAMKADHHDYLVGMLPGLLLTGIGVCFTMPTLIGAAVRRLPPANFSTGSAVVTMARQVGAVLGVAGLVAVLGQTHGPAAAARAFDHGWEFTLAGTVAAVAASCLLLPYTRPGGSS